MREEVVHIEQDVVELRAHTAVAKKWVNGIVPPEQSVAVGQCLGRLVVRSHTVKNWIFQLINMSQAAFSFIGRTS